MAYTSKTFYVNWPAVPGIRGSYNNKFHIQTSDAANGINVSLQSTSPVTMYGNIHVQRVDGNGTRIVESLYGVVINSAWRHLYFDDYARYGTKLQIRVDITHNMINSFKGPRNMKFYSDAWVR